MRFLIRASLILFVSSIFLTGCYTQLAVRDYDRDYERDYDEKAYYEEEVYDTTGYYDESYEAYDDGYYYDDPDVYFVYDYDPFWRPYHRRYYTNYFPSSSFYVGFTYYDRYWWDYCYSPYLIYPDPWFYPVVYSGYWGYGYWNNPHYTYWGNNYPYNNQYKYRTNTYTGLRNNGRGRGTDGSRGTLVAGGSTRGATTSDGGRTVNTGRTGETTTRPAKGRIDERATSKNPINGRTVDNDRKTTRKVGDVKQKDYRRYNVDDRNYKPSTRVPTSRNETRTTKSYKPKSNSSSRSKTYSRPSSSYNRTKSTSRSTYKSPSRTSSSNRSYSRPTSRSKSSSSYSRPSSSSSRSSGSKSSSSGSRSSSSGSRGKKR